MAKTKASRSRGQVIKVLPQVGMIKDKRADKLLDALLPGRRISKSGKKYTETRANRSDKAGSKL